ADDLGVLVVPLPLRLLGQHLESNQVVQELLLALERRVARADVGRLLVDSLLELADRDRVIVDLGDRPLEVRGVLPLHRSSPGLAGVAFAGGLLLAREKSADARANRPNYELFHCTFRYHRRAAPARPRGRSRADLAALPATACAPASGPGTPDIDCSFD